MLRSWLAAFHILCVCLAYLVPIPHLACIRQDRSALLSFLLEVSSSGVSPLRWLGDTEDCCLWEGVSCDAAVSVVRLLLPDRGLRGNLSSGSLRGLGRLVELNLPRNSLGGTLPQFILWSDHLVGVDVSLNLLQGHLPPPKIEHSTAASSAQFLNLSNNRFEGSFPSLGAFPHLRELDVSNNSFSGTISSPDCGPSSGIRILDLSFNLFAGALPSGFGNCSELEVLDAGFNDLSGDIPDDLFAAVQLHHLALPYNQFRGRLQGELISSLSNIVVLDLRGNKLEGELPREFGRLNRIRRLLLGDNRFNGSIPAELLSNCTDLRTLDLLGNGFTGDISAMDFSQLSQLVTVDLAGSNFSARRFPESLYACTSLRAIRLNGCSIRGRLAPGLLRLRSLSYLSLTNSLIEGVGQTLNIVRRSRNLTALLMGRNFRGEKMPEFPDAEWDDAFPDLRVLSLTGCRLTGRIPRWIAWLKKLEVLDLSQNRFHGTIPAWLGSLENLFFLQFSGNRLSGEIPLEITGIRALQLDAAQVPKDERSLDLPLFRQPANVTAGGLRYLLVSSLPALLMLQNNNLSGAIPPAIGLLKRLRRLDLSSNTFCGEIPANLSGLTYLDTLDLSRNHLRGSIPKALTRLNFLSIFSVADNNLSGPIPGGQFLTFPASSYRGNRYLFFAERVPILPRDRRDPVLPNDGSQWLLIALTLTAGICAFWATVFVFFRTVRDKY